jgi:tRNA A-37 threonylcarbamoyl transferase component Bud32
VKILDGLARFLRGKKSAARAGSFPQFKLVTDPEQMREVLQKHLLPLGEEAYEVRECRIPYRHRREGFRCVVHYDLRLAERGTGHERSQLVTGVIYTGGKTRRDWEKIQRSEAGREIPGASPTFEPFSYIPNLDMLVQVFPYDHRLPALPLLMAGPPPEIEALLLDRFGPGEWQAEAWDVEALRYRADQRAALRLTTQARDAVTGRVDEKRFYAKVYNREKRGKQTYQLLQKLWDKATTEDAGLTVGMPIAYLSDLQTLLQEESPGTNLRRILHQEEEAIPAVRKVARALATLHLLDLTMPRQRSLQDEVAKVKRAGESLKSTCPHRRAEIDEMLVTVIAGLEEVPLAPIHGDLKPGHILLDGDSVGLIDFDNAVGADPVMDIAQLLFDFDKMTQRSSLPHTNSQALAQAFADEYFSHVPEGWRARLPFLYAGDMLKKAASFYRRQSSGKPANVEDLLEQARDCLSGRVW